MPASPRIRLTFTDGIRYEDRANETIWCESDIRHKPLAEVEAGDQLLPDGPEGELKTVASKEVLPYRSSRHVGRDDEEVT